MHRKERLLRTWTGAIVAAAVLATALTGCSSRADAQAAGQAGDDVQAVEIARGDVETVVSARGTVQVERSSAVSFSTVGLISEVTVSEGDVVREAQVLARLDDRGAQEALERYQASLSSAQARLAQAKQPATAARIAQAELQVALAKLGPTQAQLDQAQASVDSAQANLAKLLAGPDEFDIQTAKLNIDKAKNQLWAAQAQRDAVAGGRGSDADKDASEANVLSAEVGVRMAEVALEQLTAPARDEDIVAAQAQVSQAKASLAQLLDQPREEDVRMAEAQLAQVLEQPAAADVAVAQSSVSEAQVALLQAERALDDYELAAPFAGMVTTLYAEDGEYVTTGAPVMQLADVDTLKVSIVLDEVDVAQARQGQPARLTLEALSDIVFDGTLTYLAPVGVETEAGTGYEAEIAFDAGDHPVRPGMTAQVDIIVDAVSDVVLVPNRAISADRTAGLYFVNKKTALGSQTVEVKLGLRGDSYSQVIEGLDEGDKVLPVTIETIARDSGGFGMMGPMGGGGAR